MALEGVKRGGSTGGGSKVEAFIAYQIKISGGILAFNFTKLITDFAVALHVLQLE